LVALGHETLTLKRGKLSRSGGEKRKMWTKQQMIVKLNSSALASPSTKISLLG
jgi:hypothetical protein